MNLIYPVAHVRFFGINKLGCSFCRLRGCSGLGARTELEAPSSSTGLLATGTAASTVEGIGCELVG